MHLRIIIPTLHESSLIGPLINSLITQAKTTNLSTQIIVVDGGSTDDTIDQATHAGAIVITSPKPGRALQMNLGAKRVLETRDPSLENSFLRFVHADIILPPDALSSIAQAVTNGHTSGCFRSRFDGTSSTSSRLRAITTNWTKYNHRLLRMGGQTVRVDADIYTRLGGFDESLLLCEDVDFYRKLYKDPDSTFIVLPSEVLVSARKFEINGYTKMYLIYVIIYLMYRAGISQQTMIRFATKHIQSQRLADADEYMS